MLNLRVLAALATAAVLGLIGCRSPDSGPQPVSWTVSWDPVTQYEGGDSLEAVPVRIAGQAVELPLNGDGTHQTPQAGSTPLAEPVVKSA